MNFEVSSLPGALPFREVHELQKSLLERRMRDEIPDTLIFCEHAPVITRGRGLQRKPGVEVRAVPLPFIPEGTDYVEIERGGDLTYHGPGQLVLYPIIKLGGDGVLGKKIGQDVDRYIRFLENAWIEVLSPFGLKAHSKPYGSGVWLGERKLASVGIALRRWVTYHGIAMNIKNDLRPFSHFDPCGFKSEVMTKLEDQVEIPTEYFNQKWRESWESKLVNAMYKI